MNKSHLNLAIFPFENSKITYVLDDTLEQYQWIGFLCGIIYVSLIFGIKSWMENRSPYKLKLFAIFWNIFLLFLNTLASVRMIPHLAFLLTHLSFYESICLDRTFIRDPVCGFWVRLFPYIKIIELGDTILLVLQKRRLVTFYWTHHLGALTLTWYIYPFYPTVSVWLSFIVNVFHMPVYGYSIIRSTGIRPRKVYSASITFLEIIHMAVSISFCVIMYYYIIKYENCTISVYNITLLLGIYVFCFILTVQLFFRRFLTKNKISNMSSNSTLPSSITTIVTK